MPKKLNYLLLLLLLPALSCTKYQLDGSIDNPDFIGTWVQVNIGSEAVINTYEIKKRGRIKHVYQRSGNSYKEEKGKGKVEIIDYLFTIELGQLFSPTVTIEFDILVQPTLIDTSFYNGRTTIKSNGYLRLKSDKTGVVSWFLIP